METLLELLKMFAYLGAAFLVLAWLGSGQRKKRAAKRSAAAGERFADDEVVDDMEEIGMAGGILGGGLENLVTGRFALRRAKIANKKRREGDDSA